MKRQNGKGPALATPLSLILTSQLSENLGTFFSTDKKEHGFDIISSFKVIGSWMPWCVICVASATIYPRDP
jgi:hypothetical protein